IRMEGKSGFDVAEYLRTQCGMPFMFLSAFADDHTVAQVKALGAVAYLMKPLDIKQIVPAVEAAFAHLEAKDAARAPRPVPADRPGGDESLDTASAMAAGVLMHRYSLTRGAAIERLREQASAEGRDVHAQAELLLAAVEQLAGSSRH
ncbi:MAG: response regulator, partial [Caldimonas sp.]